MQSTPESNPTLNLNYGQFSTDHGAADPLLEIDLDVPRFFRRMEIEAFIPVVANMNWLNWFGVYYAKETGSSSSLTFKQVKSGSEQEAKFDSSAVYTGFVFQPLLNMAWKPRLRLQWNMKVDRKDEVEVHSGDIFSTTKLEMARTYKEIIAGFSIYPVSQFSLSMTVSQGSRESFNIVEKGAEAKTTLGQWSESQYVFSSTYHFGLGLGFALNPSFQLGYRSGKFERADSPYVFDFATTSYGFILGASYVLP